MIMQRLTTIRRFQKTEMDLGMNLFVVALILIGGYYVTGWISEKIYKATK